MKNIILYHRYEIKILNKSTYEIYHSYGGVELGEASKDSALQNILIFLFNI